MDLNTYEWNITTGSVMTPRIVDLQKFMFNDRYHLTASALARVCPLITSLIVWITSFNRCRTSLLMLLSNVFLKVRVGYFRENSAISAGFPCSACICICTTHLHNFHNKLIRFWGSILRWGGSIQRRLMNCCLAGCVKTSSQILRCSSKLLVWLIT